jgi:hypothetical protein
VFSAGVTNTWWAMADGFVIAIMMVSGWVVYRFRQTRALTLAQFLEMRYSRRFRVFAGIICWLSGIINFGIFPAIGARFFMGAMQLSPDAAWLAIPVYPLLLIVLIGIAYLFTLLGGQVAVIVTDFLQGMVVNILMIVIVVVVVCSVGVPVISDALLNAMTARDRQLLTQAVETGFSNNASVPDVERAMAVLETEEQNPKIVILKESLEAGLSSGKTASAALADAQAHYRSRDSMINPFKISGKKDLNFWFYLMGAWMTFYAGRIWQGAQGYNASATTPHESRMSNILSTFRSIPVALFTVVLPLCAFAYLNSDLFTGAGAAPGRIKRLLRRTHARGVYQYARYLHALVGKHFCPGCHSAVSQRTVQYRGAYALAEGIDFRSLRFYLFLQHDFPTDRIHRHVLEYHRSHLHRRRRSCGHRRTLLEARDNRRSVVCDDYRVSPVGRQHFPASDSCGSSVQQSGYGVYRFPKRNGAGVLVERNRHCSLCTDFPVARRKFQHGQNAASRSVCRSGR